MSTATTSSNIAQELGAICSAENAVEDAAKLAGWAIDETVPAICVSPASPQGVAAVLTLASQHELCVVPAGGMSAQNCGNTTPSINILLRTNRMTAIGFYDPGDLTIGVGAGSTLAALNEALAAHHQFLPLDPMRPPGSTIGGLLASAAHGPLAHGYGTLRDFCIGLTFVTGDGRVAKGGGRVVKNVAGYDLMKLLIGSHGSLGVITSANFKVFPAPTGTRTFIMEFRSLEECIAMRDRLRHSPLTPMCLEMISPRAHEFLQPHEARDPDSFVPQKPVAEDHASWKLLLRANGSEAVLGRYSRELGTAASEQLSGEEESALWQAIAQFEASVFARHRNAMMVRLAVPPSEVARALESAESAALDNNLLCCVIGRVGLGMLYLAFVPLAVDPPSAMQYATCISALRGALPPDASAIVIRCPTEAKRHFSVWGSSPTDFGSMVAVKQALDPKNILNRGRFITDES